MDRVMLEQSSLRGAKAEEEQEPLLNASTDVLRRSVDADAPHTHPAPPQQTRSHRTSWNSSRVEGTSLRDDVSEAPHRTVQGPPSFYTATSLYRSHLPTSTMQNRAKVTMHPETDGPLPSPNHHSPSRAQRAPSTTQPRPVPSPRMYHVLAETSKVLENKRYPAPPWWRRQMENTGGDETEKENAEVRGSVDGPATARAEEGDSRETAASYCKCEDDEEQKDPQRRRVAANHVEVAGEGLTVPSRAPPPPPSRSRTRSVAVHSRSRTASPSPSPSHPTSHDNSAPHFVDPNAYHPPARDSSENEGAAYNRYGSILNVRQARQRVPSPTAGASSNQAGLSHRRADGDFPLYRDGSTASTVSTSTTTSATAAATTNASVRRLRVYEESAAHPSGFPVPRRGPGTAAPRTLYNGLAVLPATVADRSAVARAAAGGHASSTFYGTTNHPSAYNIEKYRQGIAAVTGVDPARLRDGVLQQHYTRVHSGWVEREMEGTDVTAGTRLVNTTTRLRLGLSGGGPSRALVLQDPVSGQSRKPNEVPASYLVKALRDGKATTISEREWRGSSTQRAASTSRRARGEGECSLAHERRIRAAARSSTLRVTHTTTAAGASLSAEDLRLYWAEHVPLHHAAVRGLNALLHGVGEAEMDDASTTTTTTATRATSVPDDVVGWEDVEDTAAGEELPRCHTASMRRTDVHYTTPPFVAASSRRQSQPTNVDGARTQLQDALRRRRGQESTLTASAILPATYRHSFSPVRAEGMDSAEFEADVYDGAAVRPQRRGTAHSSLANACPAGAGDRTMGLVDSYMHHDTTDSSSRDDARCFTSAPRRNRKNEESAFPTSSTTHRGTSAHVRRATYEPVSPARANNVPHPPPQTTLLFPPMLTPLLQEVDECLRFHGLPVLLEIWRDNVADQTAVLRTAGFSAAECQTIVWELERMIRVTSTTCAVVV